MSYLGSGVVVRRPGQIFLVNFRKSLECINMIRYDNVCEWTRRAEASSSRGSSLREAMRPTSNLVTGFVDNRDDDNGSFATAVNQGDKPC